MTEFLNGSLNDLYFVYFSSVQTTIATTTPTIGKNAVSKSLKITVDFVKNFILLFSKNQSKDKNDSDEVPTRSTK